MSFRKDDWRNNMKFSKDFEEYAHPAMELLQAKKVPSWMTTLKTAMELGNLKVKACGMTLDLFNLTLSDLEPVVSEVTAVASFIQESEGGPILFI
jgi:peroxiredoxin family protein